MQIPPNNFISAGARGVSCLEFPPGYYLAAGRQPTSRLKPGKRSEPIKPPLAGGGGAGCAPGGPAAPPEAQFSLFGVILYAKSMTKRPAVGSVVEHWFMLEK